MQRSQQLCQTGQPLSIPVPPVEREVLVLRALVRQGIPMLENPGAFRTDQRSGLARRLRQVLQGSPPDRDPQEIPPPPTDADAPPEDEASYEPGCLPELPEEVWS